MSTSETTGIILGSIFGALILMYIAILIWLNYKHRLTWYQLWKYINLERGKWYYARTCVPFHTTSLPQIKHNTEVVYAGDELVVNNMTHYPITEEGTCHIGTHDYRVVLTGMNKFGVLEKDQVLYTFDHEQKLIPISSDK